MSRQFTKEEAERIFALAAERQQAKKLKEEDGLSLTELEEAGLAAGIDPEFIRAAAKDMLRPDRMTAQKTFLGLPVEFRESHVLPLAFDEETWRKSVDIFSDVFKRAGRTTHIGTTRRWASEMNDNQMPAYVIAEAEEDGTRITIERKVWPMSLGFSIASMINLFIALVFFIVWLASSSAAGMIIPAGIMTAIGILFGLVSGVGLKVFSRQELERYARVFDHLDQLAGEGAAKTPALREPSHSPRILMDTEPNEERLPEELSTKPRSKEKHRQ